MKTAEEWADDICRQLGNGLRYNPILQNGKSLLATLLEPALLDARKQGMTEAAEIADTEAKFLKSDKDHGAGIVRDLILSARDRLDQDTKQ